MARVIFDEDVQSTLKPEPEAKEEPKLVEKLPKDNNYQYKKTMEALHDFIMAMSNYIECKDELECTKAHLLTHSNWEECLPAHNRPTVGDKEAYIKETVYDDTKKLGSLRVEKMYREEIYKI